MTTPASSRSSREKPEQQQDRGVVAGQVGEDEDEARPGGGRRPRGALREREGQRGEERRGEDEAERDGPRRAPRASSSFQATQGSFAPGFTIAAPRVEGRHVTSRPESDVVRQGRREVLAAVEGELRPRRPPHGREASGREERERAPRRAPRGAPPARREAPASHGVAVASPSRGATPPRLRGRGGARRERRGGASEKPSAAPARRGWPSFSSATPAMAAASQSIRRKEPPFQKKRPGKFVPQKTRATHAARQPNALQRGARRRGGGAGRRAREARIGAVRRRAGGPRQEHRRGRSTRGSRCSRGRRGSGGSAPESSGSGTRGRP